MYHTTVQIVSVSGYCLLEVKRKLRRRTEFLLVILKVIDQVRDDVPDEVIRAIALPVSTEEVTPSIRFDHSAIVLNLII